MAEKNTAPAATATATTQAATQATAPPDEFRRQAALAILSAYVQRHGGFTEVEMDAHMRLVWRYADVFVALEHAPAPPAEPVTQEATRPARTRPAHPSDEWAVVDNGKKRRGFATFEEAEFYASGRPGARIVQVAGPEIQQLVAADA